MDEPYKNREIKEMFDDVKQTLERIEMQTIKTNGRVSTLERWQSYVLGAVATFMLVGLSVGVPILLDIVKTP